MSRALRFTSTAAMPDALRQRVESKLAQAPRRQAEAKPRGPRKDSEHVEQVVFFNRIRTLALNDPRYADAARRTFAIPNGGGRTKREAGRLKAEGVVAGVSDIFVSVARGGQHGQYIEMKSLTGYPSREQKDWIADCHAQGYAAEVCRGADAAVAAWRAYVDSE